MTEPERIELVVRFPLGAYHAQSPSRFEEPEWPPHPVRLIAALVAAAAALPDADRDAARGAVKALCAAPAPFIAAPQVGRDPDGLATVAAFRGASQWAPRNHQLSELGSGVHPRDLGRGRAAVHKGGVAIGDEIVVFSWSVVLDEAQQRALVRAAEEVAFLGTSRSPVLVQVRRAAGPPPHAGTWRPADRGGAEVRVPVPGLLDVLDAWHARRTAPAGRGGKPATAGLVPPATLGRLQSYAHGPAAGGAEHDPSWWGSMLIVAVDPSSTVRPRGMASYAFARALRGALLSRYADAGRPGEAPEVLRARGATPHVAVVPLPWVGHRHANGAVLGAAIVLPHRSRLSSVLEQVTPVERGLRALVAGEARPSVGTPGVGDVLLAPVPQRPQLTLTAERWRRASRLWSTVTPVVHSRYRRNKHGESLLEQVTADCRDVGLPAPRAVELRRRSRFRGAPEGIARRDLPEEWKGPLRGPVAHLDLEFDDPVVGPVLLGRARHFGLGLCLPYRNAG